MLVRKRKGRLKGLTINRKNLLCLFILGTLLGTLSCTNSGTNSTSSGAVSSGTGTGWTITIQIGSNPILYGNTTAIMAIVKDSTGAPAPYGTNVCTTVVRNGLLKPGDATLYATICETTSNNLGQTIQTYSAQLTTGTDTIEVSSQGVIARATITVN